MTWLWQPLLPGAAQLLAAGGTTEELVGTSTGTATVTGVLHRTRELVGSATGLATVTGVLDEIPNPDAAAQIYGDLSHSPTFSKNVDKRRKRQRKEDDELKALLKRLMGEVPEDAPAEIEEAAQVAQATVERVTVPEVSIDLTDQIAAVQTARLQLAKLEALIRAYEEDEEETDLLIMAA